MLSHILIFVLHDWQWERGAMTDSFFGSRWMHTLTKLPSVRPSKKTAVICKEKGVVAKIFIPE